MNRTPRVSVLMPTFKHDWLVDRALRSLLEQDFVDWELEIVDDGSPDRTREVIEPFLADPRIRYHRLATNRGLGAALNLATGLARGELLAYLPSDDTYDPDHLSGLVAYLDAHPEHLLAYSGVRSHRHWWGWRGLTLFGEPDFELQGVEVVGNEHDALAGRLDWGSAHGLLNLNILALVQVLHRREPTVRWTERSEFVSDSLEPDFWRALLARGHTFGCTGQVTCEWTDHLEQRHKLVAEAYERPAPLIWPPRGRGLSAYRRYYGVPGHEALDWRPSLGPKINERSWYRGVPEPAPRTVDGLRIHLVGELGFNPERLLALEEAGHRLSATWVDVSETWDTAAGLPVGHIDEVPWGPDFRQQLDRDRPDVLYALLNVHAIPLIHAVLEADTGVPLVFHFKESPQRALTGGLWRELKEILRRADGLVLISEENAAWFRHAFPGLVRDEQLLVMDGDLPHEHWQRGRFAPRLSEQDGEPHIVCVGRPLSLERLAETARQGVHVHSYGDNNFHPPWVKALADETERFYLHRTVEPRDWVAELSQYDAAWTHDCPSDNRGDIRKACWSDLNLPARLGTYAAAGLPWLVRRSPGSLTATGALADRLGAALAYDSIGDLVDVVSDRSLVAAAGAAMRAGRAELTFQFHEDRLTTFLCRIARQGTS
ncbi:MAG TPA: glycosyltransferase family 2 protein [Kineosporiaceae bacterium]|nr:glycosyltransferase family 2 protein [Kineosporiaceae bacterium]